MENYAITVSKDKVMHRDFLQIRQNPGEVEEEVLHLLAEKIEAHHPHGINDNVRKLKL